MLLGFIFFSSIICLVDSIVGFTLSFVLFLAAATVVFPVKISIRLRFIARHIICVKNKPEAPTIPPTDTNKISPIAIPAIAPATPLKEFSNEIVIGISAPPTRMAKAYPKYKLTAIAMNIIKSKNEGEYVKNMVKMTNSNISINE